MPPWIHAQHAIAPRLDSLSTLVAGIAHEINNPLACTLCGQACALEDVRSVQAALQGNGSFDREAIARVLGGAIEAMEDAHAGAQRVSRIVRDLTTFGRPDPRRTRVRVADVVCDAMRWLPESLGHEATISVEDRSAPDVTASAGQLEQVIVNLVKNAARAIPRDRTGRITISHGPGSAGMARLEVADDGSGMPPDVIQRVFDPFFTTHPVGEGRGSGLGLAICQAVVTAHGGTLTVASEVGKGSTFRVELPAA